MPVRDYKSDLLVRLADPDYAALYLKTALDETLKDGDKEAFLLAVKDVADAQAATVSIADQAEIVDELLPGKATVDGTPTVEMLLSVLDRVGLTMEFKSA
ncbi:transcriptional regulator [Phormidium sp. FACHB-1136]|uniref:helix-turn-helix domain-containing transcriptional regulator n=1 Tax=Phormidium sp. FACHB-1136 TaxID=2692848 RepID=UPI001682DA9A|nr:transcriptional regulator [Phormidium sp. FACHB-1136]MBD2429204.1 transcriptional regulator [Phormidium sp. FACHB-1136]